MSSKKAVPSENGNFFEVTKMADTRLTDLVIPEVFTAYMAELTAEKSAIFQSGVAIASPEYNEKASGGGSNIQIPFFKPLSGAEEVIAEGTDLSVNNITTGQQTAVKVYRGKAFGASDIGVDFSGEDVMGAILNALAPYRIERLQDQLISTLDGAFATALASSHVSDISAATATSSTIFSSGALVDALTLLGDSAPTDQGGAIVMHSAVYADAVKAQLITYLRPAEFDFDIPFINGLRVIRDDDCPIDLDGLNDDKYTSYIFAPGAVLFGAGTIQFPLEDFRDELGSSSGIIYRRQDIMHLNGMAWQEASMAGSTPTDAELATGANWAKVYSSNKNIRVVKLVTNIGSQV